MTKKKEPIPGAALGLYVCAGIMGLLFALSVVGIFIGGQDGTRPFFLAAALFTLVMGLTCALFGRWIAARGQRKPKFASYAFEGEFAPQRKKPAAEQNKQPKRGKTR